MEEAAGALRIVRKTVEWGNDNFSASRLENLENALGSPGDVGLTLLDITRITKDTKSEAENDKPRSSKGIRKAVGKRAHRIDEGT